MDEPTKAAQREALRRANLQDAKSPHEACADAFAAYIDEVDSAARAAIARAEAKGCNAKFATNVLRPFVLPREPSLAQRVAAASGWSEASDVYRAIVAAVEKYEEEDPNG